MKFEQYILGILINVYLFFGYCPITITTSEFIKDIPLLDNVDVPLYAKLDTTKMNSAIKAFIQKTVNRTVSEQMANAKKEELAIKDLIQKTVNRTVLEQMANSKKEELAIKALIEKTVNRTVLEQMVNVKKEELAIKAFIQKTVNKTVLEQMINVKNEVLTSVKHDRYPRDCEDVGNVSSGVYRIYPLNIRDQMFMFDVYCDMETADGGWTVFQRRLDGTVDFFRNWTDYENGFGDINREFWLGNSKMHTLTSRHDYELYILLEDFEGAKKYARYGTFYVGDSASGYLLNVGDYTGSAGNSMGLINNMTFSTKDKGVRQNCAESYKGGWWYYKWYTFCFHGNLNGLYLNGSHTSFADGINWGKWRGYHYSYKQSTMMIRRLR